MANLSKKAQKYKVTLEETIDKMKKVNDQLTNQVDHLKMKAKNYVID